MALMCKNPKTGEWEWTGGENIASKFLTSPDTDNRVSIGVHNFHDIESAASKPSVMDAALKVGRKKADYLDSAARFHEVESLNSDTAAYKAAMAAGERAASNLPAQTDHPIMAAISRAAKVLSPVEAPTSSKNNVPLIRPEVPYFGLATGEAEESENGHYIDDENLEPTIDPNNGQYVPVVPKITGAAAEAFPNAIMGALNHLNPDWNHTYTRYPFEPSNSFTPDSVLNYELLGPLALLNKLDENYGPYRKRAISRKK